MSILPEAQAKAILTKVVGFSQADECTAQLTGATRGNVRFARTRAIIRSLRPLDLRLADHLIEARDQRFSFRAAGLL